MQKHIEKQFWELEIDVFLKMFNLFFLKVKKTQNKYKTTIENQLWDLGLDIFLYYFEHALHNTPFFNSDLYAKMMEEKIDTLDPKVADPPADPDRSWQDICYDTGSKSFCRMRDPAKEATEALKTYLDAVGIPNFPNALLLFFRFLADLVQLASKVSGHF